MSRRTLAHLTPLNAVNQKEASMESAIPEHLRCPRSRPAGSAPGHVPPNPAYTARFSKAQQQMTMAFVGAQYRDAEGEALAQAAVRRWAEGDEHAPDHHDIAFGTDAAGCHTLLWAAYWSDPRRFDAWKSKSAFARWWGCDDRLDEPCGWFMEVAQPRAERLETLFSSQEGFEGVGRLAEHMSGEIREHGYWGSMRDRLPASQFDPLDSSATGVAPQPAPRARIVLPGTENIALIRSGQDWAATQGKERDLYQDEVEPVLRKGMEFLDSTGGLAAGCLASRYLRALDSAFQPTLKSYGLSWWSSLEKMEQWAQGHSTHSSIFGTFMRMVQAMDFKIALRLSHEVAVLRADELRFEYLNCHAQTGLLRAAPAAVPAG